MAFNPNAVFISPSSLADFEKCPQLYYYRNVYRSPRGLKIQLINPALALGQTVHDTLDQFLRLLPEQRNKDELERIYNLLWGNISGEKGGFEPLSTPPIRRTLGGEEEGSEEEIYKERGREMLNRFLANKHFQETEAVKIPSFPKAELGNDLILTGRVDWIEKSDAGYRIIDFKTGKNEEREDSPQMPIYAVLVSQVLKTEEITACYWYLDKDENLTVCMLPDLEKTLGYLKQKGEIIKMVRQTNSFRCQSGKESCWACKEMLAIAQGKGKLVSMDPVNRKQEIYILVNSPQATDFSKQLLGGGGQLTIDGQQLSKESSQKAENKIETPPDLPF